MKVSSQVESFYDNEMHIEKILHLPSLVAQSNNLMRDVPDEFEEVLESIYDNRHSSMEVIWDIFKPDLSAYNDPEDDDYDPDPVDDLMNLQGLHGYWELIEECQFLVLFYKSKRFYSSKDSWHSGGIYYTQWIAAPSIAKALMLGKKWAKEMEKHDLSQLGKK